MNVTGDAECSILEAKVLTVSDEVVHGTREDRSGDALVGRMVTEGWTVVERAVTPDGTEEVASSLCGLTEGFHGVVVSTG